MPWKKGRLICTIYDWLWMCSCTIWLLEVRTGPAGLREVEVLRNLREFRRRNLCMSFLRQANISHSVVHISLDRRAHKRRHPEPAFHPRFMKLIQLKSKPGAFGLVLQKSRYSIRGMIIWQRNLQALIMMIDVAKLVGIAFGNIRR